MTQRPDYNDAEREHAEARTAFLAGLRRFAQDAEDWANECGDIDAYRCLEGCLYKCAIDLHDAQRQLNKATEGQP